MSTEGKMLAFAMRARVLGDLFAIVLHEARVQMSASLTASRALTRKLNRREGQKCLYLRTMSREIARASEAFIGG